MQTIFYFVYMCTVVYNISLENTVCLVVQSNTVSNVQNLRKIQSKSSLTWPATASYKRHSKPPPTSASLPQNNTLEQTRISLSHSVRQQIETPPVCKSWAFLSAYATCRTWAGAFVSCLCLRLRWGWWSRLYGPSASPWGCVWARASSCDVKGFLDCLDCTNSSPFALSDRRLHVASVNPSSAPLGNLIST